MKQLMHCLIAALMAALSSAQVFTENPCLPERHRILNETNRSTGFDLRTGETARCDNNLKRGWYKFTGLDGQIVEMPNTCPGINTCGTTTPLWMNGQFPTFEENIVTRSVCGKLANSGATGSCCGFEDELFVKKCNGFYVYYLNPQTACSRAYCAGTTKRCPASKSSTTGFEPCKGFTPELETLPVVKGPNVNPDQTFNYQCQIPYGPNEDGLEFSVLWTFNGKSNTNIKPVIVKGDQRVVTLDGNNLKTFINNEIGCEVTAYYTYRKERTVYKSAPNLFGVQDAKLTGPYLQGDTDYSFVCEVTTGSEDPDQQIEVIWTFDDKTDPKLAPQIINGRENKATLYGADIKGHLNSNVGCQARLINDKYAIKSAYRKSNTYFAGIRISPPRVSVSDSDEEKLVSVISTIPVICDQSPNCCLNFNLKVDKPAVVSLKDTCKKEICFGDWDYDKKQASFNISLVPNRNFIAGVTKKAVLSFDQLTLTGSGPYMDLFAGHKPLPVDISVTLGAGYSCSITADPHFKGFDTKRLYDLYKIGDYTVYEIKERDFLVQIRTWKCWAVTCTCGLVVKEKNDIIKIFGCDKPNHLIAAKVEIPYKLSPGAVVQRSVNGQHIGIRLTSGSEIKIDLNNVYMNAHIYTPAYDKGKARGVCGTNDGIPGNDFTHPDGTVTPACPASGRCIPTQFTESWRLNSTNSMFITTPDFVPQQKPSQYCSCVTGSTGKTESVCTYREHIQDNNITCTNCQDITNIIKPSPWIPSDQNKLPDVPQIPDVDPNQKWPNVKGVTEVQAKKLCNDAVLKSSLYSKCKGFTALIEEAMAECLGDILNGGTTDVVDATTESFTSKCQMLLAQDETNYVPGPNGGSVLKPDITTNVCPLECLNHGKCLQGGKCQCLAGWEGETCQIEKTIGPQIDYTTGNPWCYATGKACDSVEFDKSNVDLFTNLKCRVYFTDSQGKKVGQPIILDAVKEPGSSTVTCPLPKSNQSTQNYVVSVTADGNTFGNELPVYTHDSTCLTCGDFGCKQKTTACHINNVCYRDGEVNRNNEKQHCDVSKSTTSWSEGNVPLPC